MLDTNFGIKYIIAIHLTHFQRYHGVQVQLNSSLVDKLLVILLHQNWITCLSEPPG